MSIILEHVPQLPKSYDAYFLVIHGSQDLHSWLVLQELIECTNAIADILVGGGCLEGQPISLSQQILQFCKELSEEISEDDTDNINIAIVPLFLLSGVHVMQDIPAEVAIAQQTLLHLSTNRSITLELTPHLGTHPHIPNILKSLLDAKCDSSYKNIGLILLSHGSRREEATQGIENIANQLDAIAAYWSLPPSLTTQIDLLIAQGKDRIIVLPYFLSSSGITNAIAAQISHYGDHIPIEITPLPFTAIQIADMAINLANYELENT